MDGCWEEVGWSGWVLGRGRVGGCLGWVGMWWGESGVWLGLSGVAVCERGCPKDGRSVVK